MFILLKSKSTHLPASDHRYWVVNVKTKMRHIQRWAKLCLLKSGFELLPKILLVRSTSSDSLYLSVSPFLSHTIFNYSPLFLSLSLCHSVYICFAFSSLCFFYLYVWPLPPCLCLSLYLSVCLCFLYLCLLLFFPSGIHRSSLGTILLLERSSGLLN